MHKFVFGIDKSCNHPQIIDVANCITSREDRGISNRRAEGTAIMEITGCAMRTRYDSEGRGEQHLEVSGREIANAITSARKDSMVATDLRIRKLTPKECWRLMGFTDDDFEKAEKVCSNTQLYKQAGNSICVPVLEGIIGNLHACGVL